MYLVVGALSLWIISYLQRRRETGLTWRLFVQKSTSKFSHSRRRITSVYIYESEWSICLGMLQLSHVRPMEVGSIFDTSIVYILPHKGFVGTHTTRSSKTPTRVGCTIVIGTMLIWRFEIVTTSSVCHCLQSKPSGALVV